MSTHHNPACSPDVVAVIFASAGSLVFLALIGLVIWLLVRATGVDGARPAETPGTQAHAILAERYARGEIDDEEYRRRLATLGGGR